MATNSPPPSPTLISSLPDLLDFLSSIPSSSTLYLDLEGKNLSRTGTLSLMTVLVHSTQATSNIDVQTLGNSTFTAPNANGKTLKTILENPHTPKYFWDFRNDADALWAHHRVRLAGVTDVQLLENASRAEDKTYLHGLDRCMGRDLGLKSMDLDRWSETKREVQALMPHDIFARRPLDAKTVQYCANDVEHLPALHDVYTKRIDREWRSKVMEESARRVAEACGPAYEPHSEKKRMGPWGSGLGRTLLTPDGWLDTWEDENMDAMERDMLGEHDDDFSDYYDDEAGF